MGLNKKRVLIVVAVTVVLTAGGVGVWGLFFRGSQEVSALQASAEKFLEAGDYSSAAIELDKVLLKQPENATAHFQKALASLQGKDPATVRVSDRQGATGIRSLIKATRLNPELIDAHRMLLGYFIGVGDFNEASNHATAVLRPNPNDLDAQYAMGTFQLQKGASQEATGHLEILLSQENPVRPRTAWLAARLADLVGRHGDINQKAVALLDEYTAKPTAWSSIDDRLALAQLRAWRAQGSNDAAVIRDQIKTAVGELTACVEDPSLSDVTPAQVLRAAHELIPPREKQPQSLSAVYAELNPVVEGLIEKVFARAIDTGVLDKSIYINFANHLRKQDKLAEAVAVVQKGLEISKGSTPEIRKDFTVCDLWLAEYYMANREGEKAQPHIDALLATDHMRGWGQLLAGYRMVQKGDFDGAAPALQDAIVKLPDHGTANALLGLCQLRRGLVSEGRQYLEKGVRLGAPDPQYKAWLSLALSEAGYQEQAVSVAKQVLADPATQGMGQALMGQLRLRAGDYANAEEDFEKAVAAADESIRPSLRYSQAELAINRNDWKTAQAILQELKQTNMAPQAYALEFRYYTSEKKTQEADQTLAEARGKFPQDVVLLNLDVSRLVQAKKYDEAKALLTDLRTKSPTWLAPVLLLSEVYETLEESQQAIDVLKDGIAKLPDEPTLKIRLAEKLLTEKQFAEAGKTLADLKGDPKVNPATLDYLLARSAFLQGDFARAEQTIEKAAASDPDNPTLKFLLGQLAARKGDYTTASTMFEQSLGGGMYREQVMQSLFESLLRTGDTEKAIQLLGQAAKRGHSVRSLRGRLLRLLAQQEKAGLVEQELQELLSDDPDEADIGLAVSVLRYLDKPEKAQELLSKALAQYPESMILNENKISILQEDKKFDEADKLIGEFLARHPDNPTLYALRIFGYLENKRVAEAATTVAEGWKACPGNPALAGLQVQIYLRQDNPAEALKFAEESKQKFPELPHPKYLVARMYEALGEQDKAIKLLGKVVEETPSNPAAAHHFVRMLIARGETAELEPILERLIAANPQNTLLLGILAEYHANRNDIPKTRAALEKLQEQEPDSPLVAYLRAVIAFSERNFAAAEQSLKVAIADPAGHVPSTFLLARIRTQQKRYPEALQLIGQVRRQRPQHATAQLLNVQVLLEVGQLDEAEKEIRERLAEKTADRSYRMALAQLLSQREGDAAREEAEQLAETSLAEGIDNPSDFGYYLGVLLAGKRADRAKSLIVEQAAKGGNPDMMVAAGKAYFTAGLYAEAERTAKEVLAKSPNSSNARLLAADAIREQAKIKNETAGFEEAAQLYREALKAAPSNISAANNLAWTLGVHLDNPNRAMEELIQVMPAIKSPQANMPAAFLDTIGTLHLKMGHLEDAKSFLEAAISRDPQSGVAHFHLGEVYLLQKRPDRADQCFKEAVRVDPKGGWDKKIDPSRLVE